MNSRSSGVPGKGYLDCRTIIGDEARKALIAIRPSLNSISTEIDAALQRRNAAVHLASVTKNDLVIGVKAMCVTVSALLPELNLTPANFWGEALVSHAQMLTKEGADQRRLLLEQLKTVAADRLARMRAVDPRTVGTAWPPSGLPWTEMSKTTPRNTAKLTSVQSVSTGGGCPGPSRVVNCEPCKASTTTAGMLSAPGIPRDSFAKSVVSSWTYRRWELRVSSPFRNRT